jgi:glycosyltransferase involved in cell wall biosynthesis
VNVALFRAFPDAYRLSMAWYAAEILRRVGQQLSAGEHVVSEGLPDPSLHSGWRRYRDQYIRYGRYARAHAADVNHIVDHGYSHLVRDLPPERSVVTFHDAVIVKVPGAGWQTRLAFRYNLRAMRRAAAIVTPSESAKADLLDLTSIPAERVHVIPHGVDEGFRPAPDREQGRRALGLSGDVVLMVGHTQPYMNIERMLRAFGTLVQASDATLVKIGLPFTSDHMRLITELGIADRVRIVGRVEARDLPAYYQAADVLFYAPLLAGFGLPPLEAMACGTPVVCSNRGAIPEVVGAAAVMVEAEDIGALAAALATVLGSAQRRRRMADAGFERAGRFEWAVSARRLLDVYRSIARV